jgi:hypothetical protein
MLVTDEYSITSIAGTWVGLKTGVAFARSKHKSKTRYAGEEVNIITKNTEGMVAT